MDFDLIQHYNISDWGVTSDVWQHSEGLKYWRLWRTKPPFTQPAQWKLNDWIRQLIAQRSDMDWHPCNNYTVNWWCFEDWWRFANLHSVMFSLILFFKRLLEAAVSRYDFLLSVNQPSSISLHGAWVKGFTSSLFLGTLCYLAELVSGHIEWGVKRHVP